MSLQPARLCISEIDLLQLSSDLLLCFFDGSGSMTLTVAAKINAYRILVYEMLKYQSRSVDS